MKKPTKKNSEKTEKLIDAIVKNEEARLRVRSKLRAGDGGEHSDWDNGHGGGNHRGRTY